MKRSAKDIANLTRSFTRLGIHQWDASRIMRAATTLRRLAEANCNGFSSDLEQIRCDRKVTATEKRVELIISEYPDIAVYFQGDPRGAPIYLYKKSEFAARYGNRAGYTIDAVYSSIGEAIY